MRTFVIALAAIVASAAAYSADPPVNKSAAATPQNPNQKVLVSTTFRASKLMGLHVRNTAGEKLGTVDDMVVNVATGKIDYVAMGVGGVLGLGEKLLAIPYSEMKFNFGKDENFFVVNMSLEKVKAAPGFDKRDWPNVADPKWREEIDKYYQQAETKKTTTTTTTSTKD
jgi:sporulation protein YlmC with PRC-barrel domain